MEKVSSTSTVKAGSHAELVRQLLEQSEQQALKEAGEKKAKVKAVKDIQRDKLIKLVGGKGSDGAAAGGEDMSIPNDLKADLDEGLDEGHRERMENVAPVPDAYVLPEGPMVGVQHDDTREVGISGQGLRDNSVPLHEATHRLQGAGVPKRKIPKTGDTVLDASGIASRLDQREWESVGAEPEGLKNHARPYFGYVERTNRTAAYLNAGGEAGDELVQKAARSNEGFHEMVDAIHIVALRKQLKEGMGTPEFSLN